MATLNTEIKFLVGVGETRAKLLTNELKISTFDDLLYYFPFRYEDRTKFYRLDQISSDMPYIQAKGKITTFRVEGNAPRQRLIANFTDGFDTIELVWFQKIKWIQQSYKRNVEYKIFGKPNLFNDSINIIHPEIESLETTDTKISAALQPTYSTTEKLKNSFLGSRQIHKLISAMFPKIESQITETLPSHLLNELNLMPIQNALFQIHFPQNLSDLKKAEYRLKFEELFYIQMKLLFQKNHRLVKYKGFVFSKIGDYFNTFFHKFLPFELTNAQKKVLREIRRDLGSGKHTNRLLQGDVGSGKTLVGLMLMLIALDNNFQACLMAPTEILANQHFQTINNFIQDLNINIAMLTGSTKKKDRKILHQNLLDGSLQILVGTHALIEDAVQFKNLGLVIIDEQHRFGVAQRAKMWEKNTNPPHIVVMTATPIPRTLAMTVYGDLDISVIDELPPGRKSIKTIHAFDSNRLKIFGFLKKQIALGRQVYIVYPLIKESETMDYKDLTDGYESISRAFPSPEYAVGILHGQMRPEEKEKAMKYFARGITNILVATTVIEVGVNVSNASVMVIESAERFGLSQLHQLRGRVGRGSEQSYCILMSSFKLSADAKMRLKTMVSTNDGFEIAEADLKLRGPGDLEGTQQSGMPFELKIANIVKDSQLLQLARQQAVKLLETDRLLELPDNRIVITELKKKTTGDPIWKEIS